MLFLTAGGRAKSQFSQVTFIANKGDATIQLDDKNFWQKALPQENTRVGRIKTLFTSADSLKVLYVLYCAVLYCIALHFFPFSFLFNP